MIEQSMIFDSNTILKESTKHDKLIHNFILHVYLVKMLIIKLRLKCVIGPCTFINFWHWSLHFFCLVLVSTLCKSIAIGPSVNKKKLELTECHMTNSKDIMLVLTFFY